MEADGLFGERKGSTRGEEMWGGGKRAVGREMNKNKV